MFKYKNRRKHTITLIAEFKLDKESTNIIAKLSDYVSKIPNFYGTILTDLQSYPLGYRITYIITYEDRYVFRRNYTTYLAKLSSWVCETSCISKYHYNIT